MPGEGKNDALRVAENLKRDGINAILTLLGENVASPEEVDAVVEEYEEVLARLEGSDLDVQISVKPTQLGLDFDARLALDRILHLASRAREAGSFVWIDMEDSSYREATLCLFEQAVERSGPEYVGLCLQAYLRSTEEDLERLLPLSPTLRFVKGAYAERAEVAFSSRKEVDEAFFHLTTRVFAADGAVAIATHDSRLVARLRRWIDDHPGTQFEYEIQMLYGIRPEEQVRLAQEGEPVRVLISYGPAWFPWYMRRLAERPANIWFVVKNLFRG